MTASLSIQTPHVRFAESADAGGIHDSVVSTPYGNPGICLCWCSMRQHVMSRLIRMIMFATRSFHILASELLWKRGNSVGDWVLNSSERYL